MIRKIAHSILRAPAETESPTATNVPPDSRGPNSRAWMSKIGRLEPTEEPPAKKEDDDASTKTADGGSDPDRPANAPGVDADPNPGTDASNAAAAANAIAAKKKAAAEAKAKADAEAAAAKAAKPDATAAGEVEESYDIEKEPHPRDAKDWVKYKTKYSTQLKAKEEAKNTAEIRAAELEAKLAEMETKMSAAPVADPEIAAKLEKLGALNKQMESRLAELDVTKDPRFEDYFSKKIKAAHDDIKNIIGEEAGKSFIELMALPDGEYKKSQIAELYAALDDSQKSELGGIRTTLRAIDRERNEEVKNAMETASKKKAAEADKSIALAKQFETELNTQLKALQDPKAGFNPFQKRAGDDAESKQWNAGVDSRVEKVKNFLLGKDMSPPAIVKAAVDASSIDIYKAVYNAHKAKWDAEKAKLEAQVKALTAAQPAGGRGDGGEKDRTENPVYKGGIDPHTRAKNWTKSMVGAMSGEQ